MSEPTICVKCTYYVKPFGDIPPRDGACRAGIDTQMDYVTGKECVDLNLTPLCKDKNLEGKCPEYVEKADGN